MLVYRFWSFSELEKAITSIRENFSGVYLSWAINDSEPCVPWELWLLV